MEIPKIGYWLRFLFSFALHSKKTFADFEVDQEPPDYEEPKKELGTPEGIVLTIDCIPVWYLLYVSTHCTVHNSLAYNRTHIIFTCTYVIV